MRPVFQTTAAVNRLQLELYTSGSRDCFGRDSGSGLIPTNMIHTFPRYARSLQTHRSNPFRASFGEDLIVFNIRRNDANRLQDTSPTNGSISFVGQDPHLEDDPFLHGSCSENRRIGYSSSPLFPLPNWPKNRLRDLRKGRAHIFP